ncbi:D-glycero-alpha-D-manno-heptose-1,7-bisphosphate 7-phosphatase [Bacillus sp. SJS]|uniref:D-glycero-alpha-D-manno-heptose-1,7-bisphosphate 7-phosphatase n=1 Tax=Bacillus sp. SJS TaxID=1423321 RepID=UPI0004DD2597|nr:HAD family hydrolase [Bacillus sp. SJS]KZZ83748.1 D-glycero-beta-D-manno-heptose-1,7-bisphosphate 7-phosphatase [Bacillus sp. SJS]
MKKAVFLDRDGVINEVLTDRVKFVNRPDQFYLLDRAGEAVKLLNDHGYLVYVVTNQGGVGLGFMTEYQLNQVHNEMIRQIAEKGGVIQETASCTHVPNSGCLCRKPEPGMILSLAERFKIDLSRSYMIGDREPDMSAGKGAGTHVLFIGNQPGLGEAQFPTLWEAAQWIVLKN